MLRGREIDSAMRPRNKAALGGAIQSVTGKNTGAGGGAGRHVLRTHGSPLLEITDRHAGVLDVGATGQTCHFDCGSRGGVAELKPPGVTLIHYPHRNLASQVRIDEKNRKSKRLNSS